MLKFKNIRVVTVQDWNELVMETYGRKYNLQQQDGCMERQSINLTIPDYSFDDDYENDEVPEVVNHVDMGVSFKAWLKRDPYLPLETQKSSWELEMWWHRNFYPELQTLANDLYRRGLIEYGDYLIDIDW